MGHIVDNAIIMAAGTASRFAPISYETPKALIDVRGEILIERQICQLKEAGIPQIVVVVGYKKELFNYLEDKYGVVIVENEEYLFRNNNGSIFAAKEFLGNSYICSSDNYFMENPFERIVEESYYAAVFSEDEIKEWCMTTDEQGYINKVEIGGHNSWYMLGHAFWTKEFSEVFLSILEKVYYLPETRDAFWETIFMQNLDVLKMQMRKYPSDYIFEFDTLDELREFDSSYKVDSKSIIMKHITQELGCKEIDIVELEACKKVSNMADGFKFKYKDMYYEYNYESNSFRGLN